MLPETKSHTDKDTETLFYVEFFRNTNISSEELVFRQTKVKINKGKRQTKSCTRTNRHRNSTRHNNTQKAQNKQNCKHALIK